ncbi:hypothetical protein PoMZ_03388 [Pyricularia oryzae]|uniref:Uncharacterized protein n=1 Tax=Pyricularia oryzae TaxID=318829 RepID=A0A4P7NBI5_PYROR|nr:hypothetical protein PoMZ_03388 [Pyricularia oryzae]
MPSFQALYRPSERCIFSTPYDKFFFDLLNWNSVWREMSRAEKAAAKGKTTRKSVKRNLVPLDSASRPNTTRAILICSVMQKALHFVAWSKSAIRFAG